LGFGSSWRSCLLVVLGVNGDNPLEHIEDQAGAAHHLVRLRLALTVRGGFRPRFRVRVTLRVRVGRRGDLDLTLTLTLALTLTLTLITLTRPRTLA